MKVRLTLFLIIFMFLNPIQFYADSSEKWAYLDEVSDQILQMTKHEDYEKAKKLMEHFNYELETEKSEKILTMSQLRILNVSYDKAYEAFNTPDLSHEEKVQKALQFRLVVDAIHSIYQPLWTDMEQTVMGSFYDMKESLLEDEQLGDVHSINEFLNLLNVIYPSLVIDLSPEQVSKLESHISFLEQYRNSSNAVEVNHLNMMEHDLNILFSTLHMDQKDPSFVLVMASIASLILITLFYVGWRKYRGAEV